MNLIVKSFDLITVERHMMWEENRTVNEVTYILHVLLTIKGHGYPCQLSHSLTLTDILNYRDDAHKENIKYSPPPEGNISLPELQPTMSTNAKEFLCLCVCVMLFCL